MVEGEGWYQVAGGGGCRYSVVRCIMGNGHMGSPTPCEQTDTCGKITFPQLRLRAVKNTCDIQRKIINDTTSVGLRRSGVKTRTH